MIWVLLRAEKKLESKRKKIQGFILLFVCGILANGCIAMEGPPRLRVSNLGAVPIQNLTVIFPKDKVYIGDLGAGATSEYRIVPNGVYAYAAYQYRVNGKDITQPVTDWMGESPMKGLAFTYKVDYDPARKNMLQVRLVEVVREN